MSDEAQPGSDLAPRAVGKVGELGRYRLVAELARGGMGIVYLALVRGASFNKLLVVKELKPHLAEDPQLLAMFEDEGRLAARLSHHNVVQTLEVGAEGDRHFMVMEYLEGQTLHRLVSRARQSGQRIALEQHIRILIDTLAGLHYAHELTDFDGTPLGVVHRDVSPQNVFLTYEGQVKVVDFGIAKALDSSTETRTGVLKGKVAYLAPEQAQGLRVDRRADIFAVGTMLWHAVAGRKIWDGQNDMQILTALVHGRVPVIEEWVADVPPQLASILHRALAVDVDQRYPTAEAMQHELEAFLADRQARPTARELGALVDSLFAEDRARLNALVDQQIKTARTAPTGEFRALDMLAINGPVSGAFSGAAGDSGSLPRYEAPITITPAAGTPGELHETTRSPIAASLAPPPATPTTSKRSPLVVPAVGLAIVGAVAAAFFAGRHEPATDAKAANAGATVASSANASAPVAAASASAAASANVVIELRSEGAKLSVDGKPVETPYRARWLAGGRHELHAEGAGWIAQDRSVTADSDLRIEIALEPVVPTPSTNVGSAAPVVNVASGTPRAGGSVGRSATPTTTSTPSAVTPTSATATTVATPPTAPVDTGPKKPKREIDRENPFGT